MQTGGEYPWEGEDVGLHRLSPQRTARPEWYPRKLVPNRHGREGGGKQRGPRTIWTKLQVVGDPVAAKLANLIAGNLSPITENPPRKQSLSDNSPCSAHFSRNPFRGWSFNYCDQKETMYLGKSLMQNICWVHLGTKYVLNGGHEAGCSAEGHK